MKFMRKLKIVLCVVLVVLVAAVAGLGIWLYPVYRGADFMNRNMDMGNLTFDMTVTLSEERMTDAQKELFTAISGITGIAEEDFRTLHLQGSTSGDVIFVQITPENCDAPLTELYLSDKADMLNGTMIYDRVRSNLVQGNALLEKLIPEWSGGEYISMAQAEEMFGVDLTGLKEFSLSSYNNLFSLKKCFALFAVMQRTKDADGNREFYTENDSLHITLCGGESDRIQMAVNINDMPQSLEKADDLLSKAGISKSLSDKKLLHCLQSAGGTVTVGDAPEVQMPDSLMNQDVVEKISTVRTILQELFGMQGEQ